MNRYYRKPKPETIKANKENYKKLYSEEMNWLNDNTNFENLQKCGNKFLLSLRNVLNTGHRKMTPKMITSLKESIERCKNDPRYSDDLRIEANLKIRPILEKINMVLNLAKSKNDNAVEFVESVKSYVKENYIITKKQMAGLNKVYKRVSEDLFKGDKDETN